MASYKRLFPHFRICGLLLALSLTGAGCAQDGRTANYLSTRTTTTSSSPLPSAERNPFVGGDVSPDQSDPTTHAANEDLDMLDYYAVRIPRNEQELRSEARGMLASFTNSLYAAGTTIKDAPVALRDGITPIALRLDRSGSTASIAMLIDRNPPSSAAFHATLKRRLAKICQGRISFDIQDLASKPGQDRKAIWSTCSTPRGGRFQISTIVMARPAYGFWVITISDPDKIPRRNRTSGSNTSGQSTPSTNPFR